MKTLTSFYTLLKACTYWFFIFLLVMGASPAKGQLKADFQSDVHAGCAPLVVKFADSSNGNPSSWSWDLGNGTRSVLQNPSVAYFDPGTYSVRLTIRNSLGIDSVVKTQYITVYNSPVINFSNPLRTGCYPLNSQFTDLSFPGSGDAVKWEWDFGDGNFSDQPSPSHVYTDAGNFNVSLRVTNTFGCVTSKTEPSYITINSGVNADFSNSTTQSCKPPALISFKDLSTGTGALSQLWDFGDGSISSESNPTHVYTVAGTYPVSLTVTNSKGCSQTITKQGLITIGDIKADFSVPSPVCAQTPLSLINTSNPTPGSSSWDFGDGTFSDSVHPIKQFDQPGIYSVKMVSNFGSCKDSVTKSISVLARPVVSFLASSTVSCRAPFTVNFTNTSSGGARFSWDFGDGTTATSPNPTHTYLKEGVFTVKLYVDNASGCRDSLVREDWITIQAPVVSINDLPQKGCAPLFHSFSASALSVDSIASYHWDFGDGHSSDEVSPDYTYTTPGKYTVTLTYTTSGGCTESIKVENGIWVGTKPSSAFVLDPTNACADKNIQFTDQSGGNPNEWLWYFGDGSSSGAQHPVHQYNDTGYFSVTLIAIDNGCADTLTLPRAVHINPPAVFYTSAKTCEAPGKIQFTDQSIGADTWYWDFGDGHTSTEPSPQHDFASSGIYPVSLTVTNQMTGCSKTRTEPMKVVREKADFNSNESVTCKNTSVSFTASGSNPSNIKKYLWDFGDGISAFDTVATTHHQYTKVATHDVRLIIQDVNGCYDTITKPKVIQVYGPTAVFRSSLPGTCLNTNVTFLDSSYSDGTHSVQKWDWSWGDGKSETEQAGPFAHTYAKAGLYAVTLKVTDNMGCTDQLTRSNVITVSQPKAVFSADTLSCTSQSVQFHNSSTGPGLQYTWDLGDGSTSDKKDPVHLYPSEGSYTVHLSIVDQYGCSSATSKAAYVRIANPQARFSVSDSTGSCPPLVVNTTNSSINYSRLQWDFGDGTTSTERTPSHFYSEVGVFYQTLTVSGPGTCTSRMTQKIKVDGPTGTFSYTNLIGCAPLSTSFRARSKKSISFIWDFNDGTTLPTKDSIVRHSFTVPGKYVPKMILEDTAGCRVPVKGLDTITVYDVTASFDHNGQQVCDSNKVTFSSTSVSNDLIASYLWNFGDGTTSTSAEPHHSYPHPASYLASLTVITQRGCRSTVQNPNPVNIFKSPEIAIAGINGACVPASVSYLGILSHPDTSTVTWQWDFGNGNHSVQQKPIPQDYPRAGNYIVKAVGLSTNGCESQVSKSIEIYPLPVLSTSGDAIVCSGSSATLKVSGAATYSWTPSRYLSCNHCASPVSRPDSAITYRVKGFSEKGCVSIDSLSLVVKFPFTLSFSKADTLCLGSAVQLAASGTETYSWSPSAGLTDPTIAAPKASPTASTVYQVIGSDVKGCFKDTGYIPIRVYPVPRVDAGEDQTINVGRQLDIEPKISSDVTSIQWTPSTGIVSQQYPGIRVAPIQSLEYTIDVKNDGGCRARDKVSVYVLCNNANVFVPNTFSPNGDGTNDRFYPRGSGVFKILNFRVFNRWGEIVYERSNINPNDAASGWDGTYKGKKLTPDVFVYVLQVMCENNTSLMFKGNIALLK